MIEILVDDLFKQAKLERDSKVYITSQKTHKDDGISLSFEAFMRGSNMFRSHQAPPSLMELYIIYYLRLLLPCADYFETILVEYHQQKMATLKIH